MDSTLAIVIFGGIILVLFGVPVGILLLKDRVKPPAKPPAPVLSRISDEQEATVKCAGAFVAQFSGGAGSSDFTIFQFFVYPDRLVMIEVGSRVLKRAVGLTDYSDDGLPSLRKAHDIIAKVNARKVLGLKTSSVPSREILGRDIRRIENTKSVLYPDSLEIFPTMNRKSLRFRLDGPEEATRAGALLRPVFRERYSEEAGRTTP